VRAVLAEGMLGGVGAGAGAGAGAGMGLARLERERRRAMDVVKDVMLFLYIPVILYQDMKQAGM